MKLQNFFVAAAWIALFAIVVATLSPLDLRPRLLISVNAERALAFMLLGVLFAVAYPKHIWFAAAIVFIGAFGLEILQELRPDRHGRFRDAMWKFIGASIGLGMGWIGVELVSTMIKRLR